MTAFPAVAQLIVRAAVPEPPVTEVGLRVAALTAVPLIEADRLTVPVNPLTALIVIVTVAVLPARHVTLVEDALMAKSWTVNMTVADADSEPFVPDTTTV